MTRIEPPPLPLLYCPKKTQCCPRPRRPIHKVEGPPELSPQTSFSTEFAPSPVPFVATPTIDGDVLTIVIVGELDVATVHLLEEAQHAVRGTYRKLRYELAGLGFMDSTGLRALLAPADDGVSVSEVSIMRPTRAVRRLLELRGMQGMIDA